MQNHKVSPFKKQTLVTFSVFFISWSVLIYMLMLFNDRVMRMRCLSWSHTPLIQESCSQRGMMGTALCGTSPEESKSAPISTWWDSWRLFVSLSQCLSLTSRLLFGWIHTKAETNQILICVLLTCDADVMFSYAVNQQNNLFFFFFFKSLLLSHDTFFPFPFSASLFVSHSFPLTRHSPPLYCFHSLYLLSYFSHIHAGIFSAIQRTMWGMSRG